MKTEFMRICYIRMSRLGSSIVIIENILDRKEDKNKNSKICFLLFTTFVVYVILMIWRLLEFSIVLSIVGYVLSFRWHWYYEYTMVQWKFLFILVPLLYSEIACVIKMQSHSDHIIDKALKLAVNCW